MNKNYLGIKKEMKLLDSNSKEKVWMIWKNRWKKMGRINFQMKMINRKVNKVIHKSNRRRRKITKAKRTTQRIASNNL
jgi:hypothetical protein